MTTTAVASADGDGWVVTGHKLWTSAAHYADWGVLLARTDWDVPKHQGCTYFLVDMRAPGVTVRPVRQMTGGSAFNEVLLDGVRVPDSCRVGEVGGRMGGGGDHVVGRAPVTWGWAGPGWRGASSACWPSCGRGAWPTTRSSASRRPNSGSTPRCWR